LIPVTVAPVMVALSGGVDSAVAALRLLERGERVEALFMKNWEDDDHDGHCAAAEDLESASAVARHLGIRLHTVNLAAEYWDQVFARFLAELRAGRTPNPDVLCNREIKFDAFLAHAGRLGARRVATGHYARLAQEGGRARLCKGRDPDKDQSYFLYAVAPGALAQACFPVGDLTKTEVRAMARAAGLPNSERRDSTGICFIEPRRYRDFVARYLPRSPGAIRTLAGEQVGEHDGVAFYTIGQRQGLGIGGAGEAWYVAGKDSTGNVLYVVQGHDHPALFRARLRVQELRWIDPPPDPARPLRCAARIRYRQAEQACELRLSPAGDAEVSFDRPQRAVTPGQAAVFYRDERCLGGGTIADAVAGA